MDWVGLSAAQNGKIHQKAHMVSLCYNNRRRLTAKNCNRGGVNKSYEGLKPIERTDVVRQARNGLDIYENDTFGNIHHGWM